MQQCAPVACILQLTVITSGSLKYRDAEQHTRMCHMLSCAFLSRGEAHNMAKHVPSSGSVPMPPADKADAPPLSHQQPPHQQPKREGTDEDDDAVQSGLQ